MAVTKNITYVDKSGVTRTGTVTFDLMKFAFGPGNDVEDVYLVATAPGITADGTYRVNIDKICENALFASGVASRFVQPSNDYGAKFNANDTITYNVSGVIPQLKALS